MNVVRRCNVIQYTKTVSFSRLKQPVLPAQPVTFEFEQETLVVTAMRNVPHTAGNVESVGSGHDEID